MDDDECVCGHTLDEHNPHTMECEAEYEGSPCMCVYFEDAE